MFDPTKPAQRSDFHRLRKYKRKKSHSFNRYVNLYWRYHHKVYGPTELLYV